MTCFIWPSSLALDKMIAYLSIIMLNNIDDRGSDHLLPKSFLGLDVVAHFLTITLKPTFPQKP
jgi:hypothetical protein